MAIFGRNVPYLVSRSRSVGARYGVTSVRAKDRVRRCIGTLEPHGLLPTFATPGRVIEEEPTFFRRLSDNGAEFAVHGYDHVDFRKISRADATSQFMWRYEGVPASGCGLRRLPVPLSELHARALRDLARGGLLLQQQPGGGVARGSA